MYRNIRSRKAFIDRGGYWAVSVVCAQWPHVYRIRKTSTLASILEQDEVNMDHPLQAITHPALSPLGPLSSQQRYHYFSQSARNIFYLSLINILLMMLWHRLSKKNVKGYFVRNISNSKFIHKYHSLHDHLYVLIFRYVIYISIFIHVNLYFVL